MEGPFIAVELLRSAFRVKPRRNQFESDEDYRTHLEECRGLEDAFCYQKTVELMKHLSSNLEGVLVVQIYEKSPFLLFKLEHTPDISLDNLVRFFRNTTLNSARKVELDVQAFTCFELCRSFLEQLSSTSKTALLVDNSKAIKRKLLPGLQIYVQQDEMSDDHFFPLPEQEQDREQPSPRHIQLAPFEPLYLEPPKSHKPALTTPIFVPKKQDHKCAGVYIPKIKNGTTTNNNTVDLYSSRIANFSSSSTMNQRKASKSVLNKQDVSAILSSSFIRGKLRYKVLVRGRASPISYLADRIENTLIQYYEDEKRKHSEMVEQKYREARPQLNLFSSSLRLSTQQYSKTLFMESFPCDFTGVKFETN